MPDFQRTYGAVYRSLEDASMGQTTNTATGDTLTASHINDAIDYMAGSGRIWDVPVESLRYTSGFRIGEELTPVNPNMRTMDYPGLVRPREKRDERYVEDIEVIVTHHKGGHREGEMAEHWNIKLRGSDIFTPLSINLTKIQMRQLRKILGKMNLGREDGTSL